MNIKSLKNYKCFITAVLILLVFYIGIASQIPYMHDDWDWGTAPGLVHLFTADINSRYSGNLIEVIITRNEFIKTLFMGLVLTAISLFVTLFVSRIIDIKKSSNPDVIRSILFIFSNLIILLIPADVWSQTNGWVAGFSNYVVSGATLAFFFYILAKGYTSGTSDKTWIIKSILCFVFGVAIQLFLENLTVFYLLFAAGFLIVRWKKADRKTLIPLCAGLIAGTLLMFSSNIYSSLIKTGYAVDEYRQLMYDPNEPFYVFLFESTERFFTEMLPHIILHHGILVGSISIFMAIAVSKNVKNRLAALCLPIFNGMLSIYYVATYTAGKITGRSIIEDSPFISAIDCVFVLLVFIEIILVFKNQKKLLGWLIVLWLSPFLIIAPLLAVNTAGSRSFYSAYICLIAFGATVLAFLLSGVKKNSANVILVITAVISLAVCINWIVIYAAIGNETRTRKTQIESAIANGDNYIYFEEYPYKEYLWNPDPQESERVEWYKEFYKIPEDINIDFESWAEQGGMPV